MAEFITGLVAPVLFSIGVLALFLVSVAACGFVCFLYFLWDLWKNR